LHPNIKGSWSLAQALVEICNMAIDVMKDEEKVSQCLIIFEETFNVIQSIFEEDSKVEFKICILN